MKNSNYFLLAIMAFALFTFTACDDDDGVIMNDMELITTVELTFTEMGNTTTFAIRDLDGVGGNDPVKETIQLLANKTYTIGVRFLDESDANDVENITEEVQAESDEHLVCFSAVGSLATPTVSDTDASGNPLGLAATITTDQTGNATLQVVLKHEPDKSSANSCSTGETDVEVTFDVVVQ